jgi:vancomycin resistance protein YoaR
MKKAWMFIPLLLLAGCNAIDSADDSKTVAMHSSYFFSEEKEKPLVYWLVELKDHWNDAVHQISLNDYGFIAGDRLDEEALRQLAKELADQIDTPMKNAKLTSNGEFVPGKARVILSEDELVDQLLNLEVGTKELELPIYVTEPAVKADDTAGINQRLLGEYKTHFSAAVTGRSQNILLSAEAISGIVLGPGDSFSFNQTVGERTRERGYQEAKEIVNKEFVMGIGGGICQTSSTLFNAVDKAGLKMIERYTHSREIGYVPSGRDATVSWGGPDFRFENPHPYPVLIRSSVDLNRGEIVVMVHSH